MCWRLLILLFLLLAVARVLEASMSRSGISKAKISLASRYIVPLMPVGGSILDLGSGDGQIGDHVQGARPGSVVVPVDVVDIHTAGREPLIFDGTRIPMRDDSVDAVLVCFVLHHTPCDNQQFLLAECRRVLKSGGVMVIVEDVVDSPTDRVLTHIHGWTSAHGRGNFRSTDGWLSILSSSTGMDITHRRVEFSNPAYPVHRRLFELR